MLTDFIMLLQYGLAQDIAKAVTKVNGVNYTAGTSPQLMCKYKISLEHI